MTTSISIGFALALCLFTAVPSAQADAPAAHPDDALRRALAPAMQAYLNGDIERALTEADAVSTRHPESRLVRGVTQSLRESLREPERGTLPGPYSRRVADAWSSARAEWRQSRPPAPGNVPRAFVSLPPSVRSALAIDASAGVTYLLRRDTGGAWRVDDRFYTSLGRRGIGKSIRGDERTPVGLYWITGELRAPNLAGRYGLRAFPLDYPNALDRAHGRTGDGIWIHGGPLGGPVRPPRHTDGCVALADDRLAALAPALQALVTPVLIAPAIDWSQASGETPDEAGLQAALRDWLAARRNADIAGYFSLYAADHAGRLGSAEAWRNAREIELTSGEVADLSASDIEIYRDPGAPMTFLTRFRQTITLAGGDTIRTTKRLYWRRDGERFVIVAEGGG
jgi:hypothetical protein